MGKILESVGIVDGYELSKLGKLKAKKDNIFVEIEKKDKKIKEEVRDILNSKSGEVFYVKKKGIIKGLYLFKNVKDDKTNNLKHIKTVYVDEVKPEVQKKFDNCIIQVAKDSVSYQEYDKVTLDDKVIQLDPKKSKKEITAALIIGFFVGFALGYVLFDELSMALIWGLIFGPGISGLSVVVSNSNDVKEEKEDKPKKKKK